MSTEMKCQTVTHPVVDIESEWHRLIQRPAVKIWLSSKRVSQKSRYVDIAFKDQKPVVDGEEYDISVESSTRLNVWHKEAKVMYRLIAPKAVFAGIHSKSISCLDVNNAGLGVSVGSDNRLRIWTTADGSRELIGHLFEPYFCRFFPSGEVVLSSGADMQIKIWSALTGKCAVTLTGHTRAVTDSAFVDRGRNFVTVSRDGSTKLWDCSSQQCIEDVIRLDDQINSCAIQSINTDLDLGVRDRPMHPKAVGTEGKLLAIGSESGLVMGVGVDSNCKTSSAVNALRFATEYQLLLGLQSGEIQSIDVRSSGQPMKCWHTSESPVLSLLAITDKTKDGFLVTRSDGSAVLYYLSDDSEVVSLTSNDFQAANSAVSDGQHVFTGSRDSCVRKYVLNTEQNVN